MKSIVNETCVITLNYYFQASNALELNDDDAERKKVAEIRRLNTMTLTENEVKSQLDACVKMFIENVIT